MKNQLIFMSCLIWLVMGKQGFAQGASSSTAISLAKAIQGNWEALGTRGNIGDGYWRLLSIEIDGQRNGKTDVEEESLVEQPKSVVVTEREDGKFDIEIALHGLSNPLSVDYLERGFFAAAFAYGFSGFYLSFLGVQMDTFWGTPTNNPQYIKTYVRTNNATALVTKMPRAINPKLVGDLTYDFYNLETSDATYDGLGKVTEKEKVKVRFVGKIVFKSENASKVNWARWDMVDVKALGKLCEFYGPDGQVVQPKVKGVESDDSETPTP